MLVTSLYLEEWTYTTVTANLIHWKNFSEVVMYETDDVA